MMKHLTVARMRALVLTVLAVAACALPAHAQSQYSLRISDGQVYVNERFVPASELPASLDTEGLDLHYSFTGDGRPMLALGEHYYELADGTLREIDRDTFFESDGPRIYAAPAGSGVSVFDVSGQFEDLASSVTPHAVYFQQKAKELQEQAERISRSFSEVHAREMQEAAQALSVQAQETARLAESLPRMQIQEYLSGIQAQNRELFDQLMVERDLERESIQLAREIRRLEPGSERENRIKELRNMLMESFELKQENRREEIEQLEQRLEELQTQLSGRERLRDKIIDRRLEELLRRDGDMDW